MQRTPTTAFVREVRAAVAMRTPTPRTTTPMPTATQTAPSSDEVRRTREKAITAAGGDEEAGERHLEGRHHAAADQVVRLGVAGGVVGPGEHHPLHEHARRAGRRRP